MSGHKYKTNFLCTGFLILVLQTQLAHCTVTSIKVYESGISHKTPEIEKSWNRNSASGDLRSDKGISRSDKVGNVIFNDNIAFSGSSAHIRDNSRNKDRHFSNNDVAGGFLQNHRLEGPLSPEIVSSAVAAAATTSHDFHLENDLKISGDNVHTAAIPVNNNNVVRGAGVIGVGQSRSLLPGEGLNGHHGWATNPGSCLFSCASGSFGYGSPISCCQQNYVQCCPNPQHEQWNFKNLHHGRGHILGGGLGKGGYGWGSVPYNPPPIVRPKPCAPPYHLHHPHAPPVIIPPIVAGGSIIHKGLETIKHNIHHFGQFFKDGVGKGWGAGGNGAAGYYFHRRSDNDNKLVQYEGGKTFSSAKKRATRSVNYGHGWGNNGQVVPIPCPVYGVQPGYPSRPYTTGLGSLIGWSKPVNQIHGGGFGAGYSNTITYPPAYSTGKGLGWGIGYGSNFCKSDFQCPGYQRCCKGVCQVTPHIH